MRSSIAALLYLAATSAFAAPNAEALKKARTELDHALTEKDSELRGEALSALGLAHTADAKEKLESGVAELDGKVRFGAARGLTLLSDPSTAKAVAEAFKSEKGWAVRKELAKAAAATGARELIPELEKATHAPQVELAQAATWALVDLKAPQSEEALKRLGSPPRKAAHKEGEDRWSRKVLAGKLAEGNPALAARTLAELGGADDEPLLVQSLSNPDRAVRLWAAAGLLRRANHPAVQAEK